jgi:para-nitrobenzyl esterase
MTKQVVETSAGRVDGERVAAPDGATVLRFLGVPYAAPPVGERRWRAPEPPERWHGVRPARSFGPSAPQGDPLPTPLPGFRADVTDEDCLTLNIWTPDVAETRAVMVWIHGGAYTSGGAAQPVYDAARLATDGDVVVVTVGYRLGALGFLALPGADANCGLRDQLAALAWVRANAPAFGGDPGRVTVFGESAGAGSILHLLASPLAEGAAARAIAQSGEPRTLTTDQSAAVNAAVAVHLGLDAADADTMRAIPADRIVDAQVATASDLVASIGLMPYGPVLDGEVCDTTVLDAFECGRTDAVDVVLGTTRDELSLFPDPTGSTLDDERLTRRVSRLVPDGDPLALLAVCRERLGPDAAVGDVWDAVRTDAMMRIPNLRLADARAARAASRTYVYRFDWDVPGLGAAHGVDIPFTFGTFDREGWGEVVGADERAVALGDSLRRAWTTFAASGVPLPGPDVAWPAYDLVGRPTLRFGAAGCELAPDDGGYRRSSR